MLNQVLWTEVGNFNIIFLEVRERNTCREVKHPRNIFKKKNPLLKNNRFFFAYGNVIPSDNSE